MDLNWVCKNFYARKATAIQKLVRGRQLRKKLWPEIVRKDLAADKIQKIWRGAKVRESFDFRPTDKSAIKRYSANKIQALARGYLARKKPVKCKHAACKKKYPSKHGLMQGQIMPLWQKYAANKGGNPYKKAQKRVAAPVRPPTYFNHLKDSVPSRQKTFSRQKVPYTYYKTTPPKRYVVNPYTKYFPYAKYGPNTKGNPYAKRHGWSTRERGV